jgi:hypothetical protein
MSTDVLADISDAALNGSIEVEESESKTLGEKSADGAFARTARTDESKGHGNHPLCIARDITITALDGSSAKD